MLSTSGKHHEERDSSYTCEECATSFDSKSGISRPYSSLRSYLMKARIVRQSLRFMLIEIICL